eukprot:987584-Alexandrium_andersonii.AAC.1
MRPLVATTIAGRNGSISKVLSSRMPLDLGDLEPPWLASLKVAGNKGPQVAIPSQTPRSALEVYGPPEVGVGGPNDPQVVDADIGGTIK